jgi:NosR/NirI family transcriptional regulator, nitrous oxide reductase regulator
MKLRMSRIVQVLVIVVLVVAAGGIVAARPGLAGRQTYASVQGMDLDATTYKDGTYTGTASGFRPGLSVAVKVEKGKVTGITVTGHSEVGSRFYDPPIKMIPGEILKRQSTSVDVVSGATATSYGIMAAVENALAQAR